MDARMLIAALLLAVPVSAQGQPNQVTIDASVFRGTVGYARQVQPRLYIGIEAGFGFPQLDRTLVPSGGNNGTEADFEEYLHLALFARYEPASAFAVDVGVRVSAADVWPCGASDCWPVGFAGVYVQPMLGWRRLRFGPRLTAGWAAEGEPSAGTDASTAVIALSPLNLRLTLAW